MNSSLAIFSENLIYTLHSSWKHPDKERATVVAISDVEMESLEDPHREESGLDKYNQYDQ